MTAGQSTRRLSTVSLAPAPLAALLAATLLGGAMIGAGVTQYLGSTNAGTPTIGVSSEPAGTYDGAAFRLAAGPAGTYDGAAFRTNDHGPIVGKPGSGALSTDRRDRVGGR